jgi:hypothetical protein
MWPWMTFKVILYFMKDLRLLNVSIHRIFKNLLIIECARKKKAKIPESPSFLWDIEEFTFLMINKIKLLVGYEKHINTFIFI